MKRRRKKVLKPVTDQISRGRIKKDNKVIGRVHQVIHQIEKIKSDSRRTNQKDKKLKKLQEEIDRLGGLDAYQCASRLGESHHGNVNSAKWVLKKLKELSVRPAKDEKLMVLDVGALCLNYTKQRWIDCTSIDLNPQAAGIHKADFFEFQVTQTNLYDVIVLSLVLNFVGMPSRRGEMLMRCQKLCKENGYLFIILPLSCLDNSRYLTHELFLEMLQSMGFHLCSSHNSSKLSFKMFQKQTVVSQVKKFSKKLVRHGIKCNNFCITVNS